ncbi:hypothetical protein NDA11_003151 [Ustilago hordei]|nr:hypothetical protein NDA11_003151 [Ustilago hordei]
MTEAAETSTNAKGKRKLWIACNACRFRKVKCDREPRLERGFSSCTNCESASMDCILTVNPPKKRMGKRMKMLQEQEDADTPSSTGATQSTSTATTGATEAQVPTSSANFSEEAIAMSPGFGSLLQAVDQEVSSGFTSTGSIGPLTRQANANATGDGMVGQLIEDGQSHVPIVQNGMFAAFDSTTDDLLHPSSDLSAREQRRTSHGHVGQVTAVSRPTPTSTNGASGQSPPDGYISNAAFLDKSVINGSTSRQEASKKLNPLHKSAEDTSFARQVGFVGGLLGIASLDKHMLDVCTKAYFDSLGQCIGFIRPEWYWPRYHAFFTRYSGLFHSSDADSNEEPLSELLLIAVACRGAGATRMANRFQLLSDLFDHYCRLIKDRQRLVRDGFDGLESLILIVEQTDAAPKSFPDPMSIQGVFDIHILSHAGLIALMKKLELHLEKPFGARLEGRDAIRQRLLFWTLYVYDAIRAEAGRTLPLIQKDEISLPRTFPGLQVQGADMTRLMFRDAFVELSDICRKVSYRIQSNRAQGQGIDPKDVIEILDDLKMWHDKLGPLFAWDWNDMLHITGPPETEDQICRTFLIFLFLGQWLTLEYAVSEIGLSPTSEPDTEAVMHRRLKEEVDTALDRQVLVCDHGTLFGIIRLHPGMMQSWTITWATWCIGKMQGIIAEEGNGRLASAKADQAFNRYQSAVLCFINAIATCDTAQHTPTTVQDLMNALSKADEARKMSRLTFDL